MRKFSSYGPIDTTIHYYAPRVELIDHICAQLLGENPAQGGHYITIWAPRQTGKSWITNQALHYLKEAQPTFDVVKLTIQDLSRSSLTEVLTTITERLADALGQPLPTVELLSSFADIFSKHVLTKPLILIIDEFDALQPDIIQGIVEVFRNIYNLRFQYFDRATAQKDFLLHGLALIGVRSVLGVNNQSGSPFNVQRGIHIPNLTEEEVRGIFHWYEQESGQTIEPVVIDRILYEVRGQPGLTCWLGELLTETYNAQQATITMQDFERVYSEATNVLPNANILNIISKAKVPEHKPLVLELFDTNIKIPFRYDDPSINFLYLNGVVDREVTEYFAQYLRFASPFVQKRLFNHFAFELYGRLGRLYDPFDHLEDTITETAIQMPNLLRRYETWLQQNRTRLLQDAPRRHVDERVYEAIYHFNLYMYLSQFMATFGGQVYPEFPTGNGQVDLIIKYANQFYGLEVKSFSNVIQYRNALGQAARYAQQLHLSELWLVLFVEAVNDENRQRYQVTYTDAATGVIVHPHFVVTG